jgi:hypothetical protein
MASAEVAKSVGEKASRGIAKFLFLSFFKSFKRQNFLEVLYTRLIYSLVIVWVTYNPTEYSLAHWVQTSDAAASSKGLAIGALGLTWLLYIFLSYKALGKIGLVCVFAFFGLATWFLIDHGWLNLADASEAQWYTTFMVSVLFAVGMAAGILIRRLSGQMATDDVDN